MLIGKLVKWLNCYIANCKKSFEQRATSCELNFVNFVKLKNC